MEIKINAGYAGAGPNGNFRAGDVMTVKADLGKAWVKAGIATEIKAEAPAKEEKMETAEAPKAPETASRKKKSRKVSGRK